MDTFIAILFAAFVFYFVIKYAVRQAIIEAKVNESKLSTQVRANDLFNKIQNTQYEITGETKSEEVKLKAKEIYDTSFDILISDSADEEKLRQLKIKKQEMILLKSEG
ncbi:hypothetical protein BN1048_00133 [Jeotgalicoccus saudimassiliensis]|uniref:Uncharacterized protein n=1 Tax=Jeotgalicoccus saudimassiliensis TaxID=1461582 RepID=A0A078LYD7_9STAP|nr:hypothetical protein [Jeotgalicoccus saudimassiliensis]CDZ99014.1 hypothetical protein BN1048_00133 [Jeotgalicoccus saudimassiliensis]